MVLKSKEMEGNNATADSFLQDKHAIQCHHERNAPVDDLSKLSPQHSSFATELCASNTIKMKVAKKKCFRKNPNAPKRFRSSYVFFVQEKHKMARKCGHNQSKKGALITRDVAAEWNSLSESEKNIYKDMAKKDKVRYELEKDMFKGPWTVETGSWSKNTYHAGAQAPPRRPQSAFFAWSNSKKANLKKKLPNATNGEMSKLLAKKWKELAPEKKLKYREKEMELRKKYKEEMVAWKATVNSPIQQRREKAIKMAEIQLMPSVDAYDSDRRSSISPSPEGPTNVGNLVPQGTQINSGVVTSYLRKVSLSSEDEMLKTFDNASRKYFQGYALDQAMVPNGNMKERFGSMSLSSYLQARTHNASLGPATTSSTSNSREHITPAAKILQALEQHRSVSPPPQMVVGAGHRLSPLCAPFSGISSRQASPVLSSLGDKSMPHATTNYNMTHDNHSTGSLLTLPPSRISKWIDLSKTYAAHQTKLPPAGTVNPFFLPCFGNRGEVYGSLRENEFTNFQKGEKMDQFSILQILKGKTRTFV